MRADGATHVPESKKRKKASYTPPPSSGGTVSKKKGPSPRWLPALMLVLFGLGILWLVVFYISQGDMGGIPVVDDLGNWNMAIGFGFIIAGFALATQWR